ncbi:MAG TPA: ACP phosphodiesterase [Phycisphaerae bacterium]|nr:ACP phosphodiesterase [Phycisphaerae bacterium]
MNLLAHAILSPPDDAILVGNLVADWVKGRARRTLPPGIQAGFALHRRIDDFTDMHPLVELCSARLSDKWGRYSPVLVDIFFDHLLAANWRDHHAEPIESFVRRVYRTLHAHRPMLPERAGFAICALTRDDWFSTYATLDGIRLTLTRMSARLRHDVELAPAVDDFQSHRDAFREAFDRFFPELRRAAEMAPAIEETLSA